MKKQINALTMQRRLSAERLIRLNTTKEETPEKDTSTPAKRRIVAGQKKPALTVSASTA